MRQLAIILLASMPLVLQAVPQQGRTAQAPGEERVLSNGKLRVHLRPNLTVAVEDLATSVTWGSDPWETARAESISEAGTGRMST
jgi:hypothetical protein